ncbi:hypothetical protein [Runella sp. SP2]|uniref:hypothetical protein n=1 Tax=Runella sp. SP2 TaxID=2268026 RepID=UPI000F0795BE|nr:hypothetical protein [Runella sp. SP2]AYQ36597.1 hypothetical protein DTQ70_30210 [Runella sp. SP2]
MKEKFTFSIQNPLVIFGVLVAIIGIVMYRISVIGSSSVDSPIEVQVPSSDKEMVTIVENFERKSQWNASEYKRVLWQIDQTADQNIIDENNRSQLKQRTDNHYISTLKDTINRYLPVANEASFQNLKVLQNAINTNISDLAGSSSQTMAQEALSPLLRKIQVFYTLDDLKNKISQTTQKEIYDQASVNRYLESIRTALGIYSNSYLQQLNSDCNSKLNLFKQSAKDYYTMVSSKVFGCQVFRDRGHEAYFELCDKENKALPQATADTTANQDIKN